MQVDVCKDFPFNRRGSKGEKLFGIDLERCALELSMWIQFAASFGAEEIAFGIDPSDCPGTFLLFLEASGEFPGALQKRADRSKRKIAERKIAADGGIEFSLFLEE